jgi:hypothetical protein
MAEPFDPCSSSFLLFVSFVAACHNAAVTVTGTLPRIDEHEVVVDAPPDEVWAALVSTFTRLTTRVGWRVYGQAVRCQPDSASGVPDVVGAAVPGFRVVASVPPSEWALEGRHQFSRYALTFRITPLEGERSLLRAESSAVFPGLHGRVYRALVIGTGGHVVGVRSILRSIKVEAGRSRLSSAASEG